MSPSVIFQRRYVSQAIVDVSLFEISKLNCEYKKCHQQVVRAINRGESIFPVLSIELISFRSCWTAAGSRMGQIFMAADNLFR